MGLTGNMGLIGYLMGSIPGRDSGSQPSQRDKNEKQKHKKLKKKI